MAVPDSRTAPELEHLARAFAAVGELVDAIQPGQWGAVTPCSEWTVRRLVGHLIGMNRVFVGLLTDAPRPAAADDVVDGDLAAAYRESADTLLAVSGRPGTLARAVTGPLGSATGAERLQIRRYDLLAHGWDLAQAIGHPTAVLPDELAEQSLAFARRQLTDDARSGRFGPAQPVSDDAPAIERLAAFLGRPIPPSPATGTRCPADGRGAGRPAAIGGATWAGRGAGATVVHFVAPDGTRLAGHLIGVGRPLIWCPGGPMLASDYLGDLGGLVDRHPCLLVDLRGTGSSATPSNPASYRCDRQVDDLEALRQHLGLDRIDLAAHSAGAALALGYCARYPEHVDRLVLITPSPRAVGLEVSDADRREVAELRRGEPWFSAAFVAFERIWAGTITDADWDGITPFTYGRWDDTAQRYHARQAAAQNADAAQRYYAAGALDPVRVRAAASKLEASVLLAAGEYDVSLPPRRAAEYARLFRHATPIVLPGGGHYPWLDDPNLFVNAVLDFLRVTP